MTHAAFKAGSPPGNAVTFASKTKKAQGVAKACASGFRKVCLEVIRKKGAMARC